MQSLSAELHNGRVKVSVRKDSRKGSKAVEAVSQAGLNTGQWRKVRLEPVHFLWQQNLDTLFTQSKLGNPILTSIASPSGRPPCWADPQRYQ